MEEKKAHVEKEDIEHRRPIAANGVANHQPLTATERRRLTFTPKWVKHTKRDKLE